MNNKIILPIACLIIALIIGIVSFVGPWYSMEMSGEPTISSSNMEGLEDLSSMFGPMSFNVDYYLKNVKVKSNFFGMPVTNSISYSEIKEQSDNEDNPYGEMVTEGLIVLFDYTFFINIALIVLLVLSLVFVILYILSNGSNFNFKRLALIFGILIFILSIFAMVYFYFAFTTYMNESANLSKSVYESFGGSNADALDVSDLGFWYSTDIQGVNLFMGPGYGWYLIVIGGIFALFAGIFINKTNFDEEQLIHHQEMPVYPPQD